MSGTRRVFIVLAVLSALAALVYGGTYYSTTKRPPRTIHDAAFESQADGICKGTVSKLRAVTPSGGTDSTASSLAALSDRVVQVSDGLAQVEARLRAVPVHTEDRAKVGAWLHQWDVYIAVGRRYAVAIRTGDQKHYTAVGDEGNAPVHDIARFARGNHIDDCVV